MRPAVFFDRDGTLNEELGYVGAPERFHFYPFAAEAVRLVNAAGWPAILVTNQAGVARGLYTEADVARVHAVLEAQLGALGARLDAIYYCPHHPTKGQGAYRVECACRKPQPGMLVQAAREHDLDLTRSFVISDLYREVAMAYAVGGRGALVLTGYGQRDYDAFHGQWRESGALAAPAIVAENVLAAVRRILPLMALHGGAAPHEARA